jgi:signal transduction histidine kinase
VTTSRWRVPAPARRVWKFRFRLAATYAALFLSAGAALLALTYGLVAHSLPKPSAATVTSSQKAKAALQCKIAESPITSATPSGTPNQAKLPGPSPKGEPAQCKHAYLAGATEAAQNQRDHVLHDLLVYSLLGLGAMTLVSGALGWLMAGRVLRPLRVITGAARRASDDHLGERLGFRGPRDELRELADTFDDMLDRLDAAFALQRRFVADASHELRTPLTVMRTAVDVTLAKPSPTPEQLRAMAVKVRKAVDQAESMVHALLSLARSQHSEREHEEVDLADVARDVLDDVRPVAGTSAIRVKSDLGPANVIGDRRLLEVLVGNLVDNAFRHNIATGWVDVFTGVADEEPFVTVANSGPVVPDDMIEGLFEPFRRMEARTNSQHGVGLGLAIVKSVAQAHGAVVQPQARLGGGLSISVVFPAPRVADTAESLRDRARAAHELDREEEHAEA